MSGLGEVIDFDPGAPGASWDPSLLPPWARQKAADDTERKYAKEVLAQNMIG
jgi:hypothetical protein